MRRRVPYSQSPKDLFRPGDATDLFDPDFGPIPSDAGLCSEMARLAYVRHEVVGGRARLETFLHRAGFTLNQALDIGSTQAFVAAREGTDAVTVVAFRGTEADDPRDLRVDANALGVSWRAGGTVHGGFAESMESIRPEVMAAVGNALGRLLLTGHSLGGGLAVLAASLVASERRAQTALYTFGCPRVGDETFGQSLVGVTHVRYAGACDLVTMVPPVGLFPYVHHGMLHCIDGQGAVHTLGVGEQGQEEAEPFRTGCRSVNRPPWELLLRLIARKVPVQELTDHAPINYTSAIWKLR